MMPAIISDYSTVTLLRQIARHIDVGALWPRLYSKPAAAPVWHKSKRQHTTGSASGKAMLHHGFMRRICARPALSEKEVTTLPPRAITS